MQILRKVILASLLCLVTVSTASADWLVTGATVSTVRTHTRSTFGYWFQITVSGGNGPCAGSTIEFVRSSAPSANERSGAEFMLSALLGAQLSGKPVNIGASGTTVSCTAADLITITN